MAIRAKFEADFTSFTTAVEKAELSLKSFETGATKVGNTLNKMADQFSGRKVIQEATLMVSAIEKLGGVSGLTDAELKRVAAVTEEAAAKMRKLGLEVPKSFNDIAEAAKKVKEPVEGISTKMIALGTAAGTFIGKLAYDAVKALATGMVELAANGIKMAPVVSAFEKLTAGIGESADVMVRTTRTATKGLITDLDIMAASNKAMLLGLPVTSKEMGVLGAAAVTLGKAMKQDAAKSLDDLITALGRSSPMILDNLGLTVRVEEANKKYAAQVGKTAESLTDAEKKLAFYNAAMDAAKAKVDTLGGVQLTLADQILRVKNQFENFTDALGIAIARSPVLNAAFESMADGLESAFGGNQVTRVQELIKWVNEIAISAVGVGQSFIELTKIGTGSFAFLKDGILGLLEAQFRVRAGIRDLIPIQKYKEEASILRAMADSLRDQANESNEKQRQLSQTLDAAAAAAGRMQARMREAAATQGDTARIAEDLTKKLGKSGGVAGVSEDVAKAMESIRKAAIPLTSEQQKQVALWDKQGISAETMAKALNVSTVAVQQHLESQKLLAKEIPTVNTAMADFTKLVSDSAVRSGLTQINRDVEMLTGNLDDFTRRFSNRADLFPEPSAGTLEAWKKLQGGITETLPLLTRLKSAVKDSIGGLNDIFQRAFEGGGGIGGAIKSFTTNILGGLLQQIPVVGGVLSKFAGTIVAAFSKIFGKSEESSKVSPARDEFFKLAGGLEVLNARAMAASGSLALVQAIFNAKTVEQYNKAIADLNNAFAFQEQALKTLDETAKKYGFTIEELGPAWQRQELDKKAQELFRDYQILTAAGVDHTKVLEKMAGAVNEYVNRAIQMGQEVPEAMRPMLEAMIANGQLLDANGNKITDLEAAGVKFSITMSEGFKMLVAEVQKLTDVIARSLGISLDDVRRKGEKAGDAMEDGFERAKDAANDLADAIEGVSYGNSPGGLKDIIAFGRQASDVLSGIGRTSVGEFGRLLSVINAVSESLDRVPKDGISPDGPGNLPKGRRGRDKVPDDGGRSPDDPPNLPPGERRRPRGGGGGGGGRTRDDGWKQVERAIKAFHDDHKRWFGRGAAPRSTGRSPALSAGARAATMAGARAAGVTVNVNGGTFDTPGARQDLAVRVSRAIMGSARYTQRLDQVT